MRAVPIAPAAVQTHAIARDAVDGLIERRDVHFGGLRRNPGLKDRDRTWSDPWPGRARRSAAAGRNGGWRDTRCASRARARSSTIAGNRNSAFSIVVEMMPGDGAVMKLSAKAPESRTARWKRSISAMMAEESEVLQLGLRFRGVLHAAALGKTAHEVVHQGRELLEVAAAASF